MKSLKYIFLTLVFSFKISVTSENTSNENLKKPSLLLKIKRNGIERIDKASVINTRMENIQKEKVLLYKNMGIATPEGNISTKKLVKNFLRFEKKLDKEKKQRILDRMNIIKPADSLRATFGMTNQYLKKNNIYESSLNLNASTIQKINFLNMYLKKTKQIAHNKKRSRKNDSDQNRHQKKRRTR